MKNIVQRYIFSCSAIKASAIALILVLAIGSSATLNLPQVEIATESVAPRVIEDTTQQAVARDYAKSWQAMADARDQNRPDLLGSTFVGFAKDEIEQAIRDQQQSNLHVRYIDHGHKLQAIFYSQEGSAIQLRDTASIERQVFDGDSVIHAESRTINYIVLMTPAADHWQVRMLQEIPGSE